MKERLKRLEQIFQRNPIYFVTACTYRRRNILNSAAINLAVQKFAELGPEFGAWMGGYILMPDHVHLFVRFDDRLIDLSRWGKSLKNTLSKVFRANGCSAPHWQKSFHDHVLRSAQSYSERWHYVRENAVRAGLVAQWEDWPYLGEPYPLMFS